MLIARYFSVCGDGMHLESNRQLTGSDNCTNDAFLLLQTGRTVVHTAQVKLLPCVLLSPLSSYAFILRLPPQDQFYIHFKVNEFITPQQLNFETGAEKMPKKSVPSR